MSGIGLTAICIAIACYSMMFILMYVRKVVEHVHAGKYVRSWAFSRWIVGNTVVVHTGRELKAYVRWRTLDFALQERIAPASEQTMVNDVTHTVTVLATWMIKGSYVPAPPRMVTFSVRERIKQMQENTSVG